MAHKRNALYVLVRRHPRKVSVGIIRPRREDNIKIALKFFVNSKLDFSPLRWELVVSSCAYGDDILGPMKQNVLRDTT
jgi:hypothetical protein